MSRKSRSFAVIGLGTFGGTVALEFARFETDVIGIESDEKLAAAHAQDMSQALFIDAR